jgi:tRNA-Thr(GGU) m(6)t(6)A37 methyltransferase TsaA
MSPLQLRIIGTIRTPYTSLDDTPVQAGLNPDGEGSIEFEPPYAEGLDGLEEFTHAWLLTWLAPLDADRPEPGLRQVPFLLRSKPRQFGIFAMRGPRRPNPIGLSLVRLLGVDGATVRFAGVDMVDGTSLLDLKPYAEQLDSPKGEVRSGWFDGVTFGDAITPSQLARRPPDII